MSAMPCALESLTLPSTTVLPLMLICPSSGGCTPPRIFISVLLPAPFSPMSASTSPARSDSETPCRATTPGKRLVMPRISSKGGISLSAAALMACGSAFSERWGLLHRFFHRAQLELERVDVALVDDRHARIDDARGRQRLFGFVFLGRQLVHPLGRQVAELEGLLHDSRIDGAVFDPVEGGVVLVEHGGFDLALLAQAFDGRSNGGAIVVPQADHQAQILVGVDDVFDVGASLGAIRVVLALVDDFDLVILDRSLDPA